MPAVTRSRGRAVAGPMARPDANATALARAAADPIARPDANATAQARALRKEEQERGMREQALQAFRERGNQLCALFERYRNINGGAVAPEIGQAYEWAMVGIFQGLDPRNDCELASSSPAGGA